MSSAQNKIQVSKFILNQLRSLPGNLYCCPQQETDPSDAGGQWNVHSVQLFIITVNSHTSNPSPPQTGGAPASCRCCQKLTLPSLPLYLATGLVPLGFTVPGTPGREGTGLLSPGYQHTTHYWPGPGKTDLKICSHFGAYYENFLHKNLGGSTSPITIYKMVPMNSYILQKEHITINVRILTCSELIQPCHVSTHWRI